MAATLSSFFAGIKARFAAAGLGAPEKIRGGIHLMRAPAGTELPLCVVEPIAMPETFGYGNSFVEPQLQFTVRGIGAAAALVAAELLMAAFDDQALTIGGGQSFHALRDGRPMPEPTDPIVDETGDDSFGWIVTYRFAFA